MGGRTIVAEVLKKSQVFHGKLKGLLNQCVRQVQSQSMYTLILVYTLLFANPLIRCITTEFLNIMALLLCVSPTSLAINSSIGNGDI